ncbi:hypothetical protein OG373_02775 [Streptomyces avidinii]|nr:hypothetical protein OG373_02775 [Streptomyces avidinii]
MRQHPAELGLKGGLPYGGARKPLPSAGAGQLAALAELDIDWAQ